MALKENMGCFSIGEALDTLLAQRFMVETLKTKFLY
jgi:hypothetical protein